MMRQTANMCRPWHTGLTLRMWCGCERAKAHTIFPHMRHARTYATSSSWPIFAKWRKRCYDWFEQTKPVAQNKLSELSHKWNDYTGYGEINALKGQVQEQSEQLKRLQHEKETAKSIYIQAISERSAAQRRINDLLSRKSTWRDNDLTEYTSLLHSEHSYAKAEEQSQHAYERAESDLQRGFDDLMRVVMRRYHEEHLWSDRVRSVSTYVSVGLGVLNVLVFILALFVVEPFKRRRLAQTLETRLLSSEEAARERMHTMIASVDEHLAGIEATLSPTLTSKYGTEQANRDHGIRMNFTWVRYILDRLKACRAYVAMAWDYANPFPAHQDMQRFAATASGVMIGSMFSYILLLFLQ